MSRIKRAKPSPALIVAVVALVAALCGGAVAGVTISKLKPEEKNQVKRISKRQAKKLDKKIELLPGPKGEQGVPGTPATKLFASVHANGDLEYGEGVKASENMSTGAYKLTFDRDLTNCVGIASTGGQGGFSAAANASVHLPPGNSQNADQLVAYTASSTGFANNPVQVAVFC